MNKPKPSAPIVFVTGIGQTWSTLGDRFPERWNLFPRSKEVIFSDFRLTEYINLGVFAAEAFLSLLTGRGLRPARAGKAVSSLMKYCTPDKNGRLSDKVKVRIYGPNSFDKLAKTDFKTGELVEDCPDPLLNRLYRDIPCRRLSPVYGEENLYCFNYSSFSRLYSDADALNEMIKAVIADQKNKTGSDRVILVPMSMGATVVNAYLDKYGSAAVDKVISIVGAWNGSNALADLLMFKTAPDAKDHLGVLLSGKALDFTKKLKQKNLHKTLKTVVEALVESVFLKTTTFTALIPSERYEEVTASFYTPEKLKRNSFLCDIKAEADRYHNAQQRLFERFDEYNKKHGTDFYFISGYGLNFGEGSNDFSFLKLMASAKDDDTDGVIQISSTTPGTKHLPDGKIDGNSAYFSRHSWYFEGQKHELGTNNTALKLAFDIALGEVSDIDGKYPQFNRHRDIKDAYMLLDKAKAAIKSGEYGNEKTASIISAVSSVEKMLESINNDPENDGKVIDELRKLVK